MVHRGIAARQRNGPVSYKFENARSAANDPSGTGASPYQSLLTSHLSLPIHLQPRYQHWLEKRLDASSAIKIQPDLAPNEFAGGFCLVL
jgi:hypothetical protein